MKRVIDPASEEQKALLKAIYHSDLEEFRFLITERIAHITSEIVQKIVLDNKIEMWEFVLSVCILTNYHTLIQPAIMLAVENKRMSILQSYANFISAHPYKFDITERQLAQKHATETAHKMLKEKRLTNEEYIKIYRYINIKSPM